MRIRDVAKATGLTAHTLRWYEKIGLLRSVERDRGGRRLFTQDDLRWLEFIGRLREMDMPVREMVRYAELREQGDATLAARRELLEAHRQRVRKRMERLAACLTHLDDKIAWYRGQEDDHA